jgi:hypothetical protein
MLLNDLLVGKGIDPTQVLVFRHRPTEPELRKVLPWLADEKPELFNAYQQTQGVRVENAMLGAKHVASFVGHQPGKALFIGLYAIGSSKPLTREEYWRVPAYQELKRFGIQGFNEEEKRATILWFDLELVNFYPHWKGKLIVGWPPPEIAWWRRAHQNEIPVLAILQESFLDRVMPDWKEIDLSWDELAVLPSSWRSALSQWRGIYFIFDRSDGKGYVGSAYGTKNILGRWLGYAASGHGGNRLLRQRDPQHFRFTIIQRVSPDMDPDEIILLEATWKQRLHTRAPYGLNEN